MTIKQESEDPNAISDFLKSGRMPGSGSAMETGDLADTRKYDRCSSCVPSTRSSEQKCDGRRSESFVHHQVLKIREEDSHLGEDIGEGLGTREKLAFLRLSSQMGALFYTRPMLPSSPLGNKTAIKSCQ